MVEIGDRLPRAATLLKLAGGLEVGVDLLLRGIGVDTSRPIDRRVVAVGYMVSRGLAKSGSCEPYDEDRDRDDRP